jgi:hypothetical protein|tara:strand:- start:447 stop:926 length:480 start_codon:yes stop_codon:yes gene_type:complete
MTDSDSTGNSDTGAGSSTESKPNWRRDLEKRANEAEQQAAEMSTKLNAYERRDTFRSAGLDPDDSRVKYFVKGYDGELSAEAIREEAVAAGFIGDDAPLSAAHSMMQDTLKSEQRIQNAGEGGEPVISPDLQERIKATNNEQELRALMESEGFLWGASV